MSPYDLNIMYQPGQENTHADALSRQPDYIKGMKSVLYAILEIDDDDNLMTVNRQVNLSATLTLQPLDIEDQIKEGYKTDTMA